MDLSFKQVIGKVLPVILIKTFERSFLISSLSKTDVQMKVP